MQKYISKILKFKKDLDKLAELSWEEEKTKDYIIGKLGKPHWSKKTAVIYRVGKGVPVFFRAELDGLDTVRGIRHTCGHSAHMAALMAAYLYFKKKPPGNFSIYFVFQPSEESYPSGAKFISDNFSELNKCRAGFAFHVDPDFSPGIIANPIFASGDYFEIKIDGVASHVKYKNFSNRGDALLPAVDLLKTINRKKSQDWIVNVGKAGGGEAPNKIAGGALLSGDIRALSASGRKVAYNWLKMVCANAGSAHTGVKIHLRYYRGYPILKNNAGFLEKIKKILSVKADAESFGTEDFSLYKPPKMFLLVGTGGKAKMHSDNFKVSNKVAEAIFKYWVKIGGNLDGII